MLIFKWFSFTFVNLFEISNLWDPTFPHPIILGRSEKWSHRKNIFQAHTLYDTADIHSPIPSFRAQREIFLALCSFLLLSQKVSPFPLSHIRLYPLLQERSLDFARDDDTGIALSKHIRCSLHEINPFPHTVISSKVEKYFLHSTFSCFLRKRFPLFRYHTYGVIPVCQKDPSTSLGMTIREAFSKHIRCTLREINPFPPRCHFERSEKSSLHSALSCSFRKRFPLFRYHTYDIIPFCKKDPSTSLGMTIQE